MNAQMKHARPELERELERHEETRGMYVRVHGQHFIVGRVELIQETEEPTDRVRLTRLSPGTYGLSVKRHTGRWERTPFSGSIADMVEVMHTVMQHLVAAY